MAGNIKGVTIEFRGETTKLQSALNTLRKETRSLDQELKQIDRALKFNPGNTELVAQKQTVLKEKVQQTKQSLDELKKAQAQMDAEGVDKNSEAYRRVQREIIETESKLKHYEQELERLDRFKFEQLGKSIQNVGDKMESIGKGMSKYVTAPIVAAAAGATKAWKDVDEGLDIVTQKTGATGDALKEMHNIVKDLSGEVPADFNDIGSAVGEVNTRFGVTGDKLQELSKKYLEFAQLNDTDVSTAVDKSQKALRAWNLDVDDAGPLLDTLNKVGQDTGVSMDSLMDSMVKNAPALQQMNLSWDQAATFLGQVEVSGVDADKALAGLNKAMVKGAKEGKEFPEVMHDLQTGIKGAKTDAEAMSIASEYFGTKAGPALAQAIRNGTINLEEMSNMSVDAKGNLEKTFMETLDPADKFQLILNQIKVLGYDVADTMYTMLAPAIEKALQFSKDLRKKWEEMSPTMQGLILKIAGFAAAMGPMLVVGGKMTKTVGKLVENYGKFGEILPGVSGKLGKFFSFLKPSPVMLVVAALAALALAFYKSGMSAEELKAMITMHISAAMVAIKNFVAQLPSILPKVIDAGLELFNGLVKALVDILPVLIEAMIKVIEGLVSTLPSVLPVLVQGAVQLFTGLVQGLVAALPALIQGLVQVITALCTEMPKMMPQLLEAAKAMFMAIVQAIPAIVAALFEALPQIVQAFYDVLPEPIKNIFEGIKNTAIAIWEALKEALSVVVEAIKNSILMPIEILAVILGTIWYAIKTAATAVWDQIKGYVIPVVEAIKDTVSKVFEALKAVLEKVWGLLKALAQREWNGIKKFIIDPVVAAYEKVKSVFDTVKSYLSSAWNSIKSTASSTWNSIKDTILRPVETLRDKIKAIIDKIKGFFNFTVKTPKIPLPHFSISPSGWSINDLLDGSIPHLSVDWYAKGAIFDKPTIFRGVGEAGPEAVLPLDTLWQRLDTMADSIVNGIIMGLRTTQLQGAGGDITIPIYLYPSGPKMGEETVKAYDKYKKILG